MSTNQRKSKIDSFFNELDNKLSSNNQLSGIFDQLKPVRGRKDTPLKAKKPTEKPNPVNKLN